MQLKPERRDQLSFKQRQNKIKAARQNETKQAFLLNIFMEYTKEDIAIRVPFFCFAKSNTKVKRKIRYTEQTMTLL